MKVLILEKDQSIAEILRFSLDSLFQSSCVFVKDLESAIQTLNSDDFDLLISDYEHLKNGAALSEILKDKGELLPFVLLSSFDLQDIPEFEFEGYIEYVRKPHIFDGIRKALDTFKKKFVEDQKHTEIERKSYVPVSLQLLKSVKKLECDIYLKVGDKLLKMLNSGSTFDNNEYQKYDAKNVKFLYLKCEESKAFIVGFEKHIHDILDDNSLSSEQKVMSIQDVIHESVSSFGINENVVNQAAQSVNLIKDKMNNDRQFKEVLGSIFDGGQNYLSQHSIALIYIGIAIAKKSNLYNEEMGNKLATAALLHDITLDYRSTDEYLITSLESVGENFLNHPQRAADLASKMKNMNPDVDKMIREHHEKPDGSGFPKGINAKQINILSAFFNFSHLVVETIYKMKKAGDELTMENLRNHLPLMHYNEGNFKKVIAAFDNAQIF